MAVPSLLPKMKTLAPALFCLVFGSWTNLQAGSESQGLLAELLQLDTEFLGSEARDASGKREAQIRLMLNRARSCSRSDRTPGVGPDPSCIVSAALDGVTPDESSTPLANSLTGVLASQRGTCSSMVATVLGLNESLGGPLEAVVLRDHVVLGIRGQEGRYLETLDGGRPLMERDLSRFKMPPSGRPLRLGGREFVAYYLDNLAARLSASGDKARAEAALLKALAVAPKAARIHYNYGTLLLELGRNTEALHHLRKAIAGGWDDADAWVNRGVAESKLNRLGAARRSFEVALKKDPHNTRARENILRLTARSAED